MPHIVNTGNVGVDGPPEPNATKDAKPDTAAIQPQSQPQTQPLTQTKPAKPGQD